MKTTVLSVAFAVIILILVLFITKESSWASCEGISTATEIGSIIIEKGSKPPCCYEFDIPVRVYDTSGNPLSGVNVQASSTHSDYYSIDPCAVTDDNGTALFYMYGVFWNYNLKGTYPIQATFTAGSVTTTFDVYPIICEVWGIPSVELLNLTVGETATFYVQPSHPCSDTTGDEVCIEFDDKFISVDSPCTRSLTEKGAEFDILAIEPGKTLIYIDYGLAMPIEVTIEPTVSSTAFSGEVVDAKTGLPVDGKDWKFFLFPGAIAVEDSENGKFEVDYLKPGKYFAVLFKKGYVAWFYMFELDEGEEETIIIELLPR